MNSNYLFIILCLAVLAISGCLSFDPSDYRHLFQVRIGWNAPKIFNTNQSNLLTNISKLGFNITVQSQNKTVFFIQSWKHPKSDINISFDLVEYYNYSKQNITYNTGFMTARTSFPNDQCESKDNACIQARKRQLEQECDPVLDWLNITVNWDTLKWLF
jgi:hypothetical protein